MNRALTIFLLLVLIAWAVGQVVYFAGGYAYDSDPVLKGCHRYLGVGIGPAGVMLYREIAGPGWAYRDVKPGLYHHLLKPAKWHAGDALRGAGFDFYTSPISGWAFIPYWLVVPLPSALLAWRLFRQWRRSRKPPERGFEVRPVG